MRSLKQQLSDLSARAKKAEDDATVAQTEQRAKIQARVDKLQPDTTAGTAAVTAAGVAAKDATVGQWHTLQQQVKSNNDCIRADINATKAEHEKTHAQHKAQRAEENAAAAIVFAYDTIDYAEAAVLDAVMTRVDADAVR